jgi:rRNA maturation endonuclease Nob1
VAVLGAAVTKAGAAVQIPPLSAEAQALRLEKTDAVADMLEERHILDEDVKRVIQNAESTGDKLYQTDTDHFLSKLRVGEVTFYVEYSRIDKGYRIHTAYSHRFLLEED